MADFDTQVDIKETKAKVEFLRKKVDALIRVLEKEGVTTNQEVESFLEGKE